MTSNEHSVCRHFYLGKETPRRKKKNYYKEIKPLYQTSLQVSIGAYMEISEGHFT